MLNQMLKVSSGTCHQFSEDAVKIIVVWSYIPYLGLRISQNSTYLKLNRTAYILHCWVYWFINQYIFPYWNFLTILLTFKIYSNTE